MSRIFAQFGELHLRILVVERTNPSVECHPDDWAIGLREAELLLRFCVAIVASLGRLWSGLGGVLVALAQPVPCRYILTLPARWQQILRIYLHIELGCRV